MWEWTRIYLKAKGALGLQHHSSDAHLSPLAASLQWFGSSSLTPGCLEMLQDFLNPCQGFAGLVPHGQPTLQQGKGTSQSVSASKHSTALNPGISLRTTAKKPIKNDAQEVMSNWCLKEVKLSLSWTYSKVNKAEMHKLFSNIKTKAIRKEIIWCKSF